MFPLELKDLTKGSSQSQVITTLYNAHLLQYSTHEQLKAVSSPKIATKKKLQVLAELGYLVKKDNVFVSTSKTLKLLGECGYNKKLLPPPRTGKGEEIYNTDAFIYSLKLDNYKALLFPEFGYIKPDGLLVQAENGKYKISFLEVEKKKTYWERHLETKKSSYQRLASDRQVFVYWKHYAPLLGLRVPDIQDFKFGVLCFSKLQYNWDGWEWISLS